MKTNLNEYLESGKYLPKPLRDWHDQKDVFKTMHSTHSDNESIKRVNWIDGQCYVIDVFLWFMARRGWTLQRSRVSVEFRDLQEDVKANRDREALTFKAFMDSLKTYEK